MIKTEQDYIDYNMVDGNAPIYQQEESPPPRYYAPQNPYGKDKQLLEYQLDNNPELETFRRRILGITTLYNADGEPQLVVDTTLRLINEEGANYLMSSLSMMATKIFSLTNYDEYDVNFIQRDITEPIIDRFYQNHESFEIKDPATASMILRIYSQLGRAILNRSIGGTYLRFLQTTNTRNETILQRDQPQQQQQNGYNPMPDKSIFKKFLRFGR